MQSWLEGRNWVGKCAQATGMTSSLRILSSKADSNTWESFTRSELKLESVHQESPRSDVFRKRATKPLLKQKHRQKYLTWAKEKKNWTVAQWSKVLFSDKSKFCISFGNQGPRVWRKSGEAQNPSCLKSSVRFPKSVMIWGAVTSAGVGPLCFIKSKVNAAVLRDFRALYASICWQALWRCWFPSIECINEHTLKNLNFSVLQILFLIDLRKYSNILRYWFLTFISCKL